MEKKMNVTLKPDAEKLVREKVERGEFKDASDLVDEAIHYLLDMDEAEAELEALVREGIESGPATEMTHDTFEAIRREVRAKYGRKE
jgi:putative addiction module CopG family antidote